MIAYKGEACYDDRVKYSTTNADDISDFVIGCFDGLPKEKYFVFQLSLMAPPYLTLANAPSPLDLSK